MAAANADKPSKSARKREHLALQGLGEALIRLGTAELETLPLDERLREALLDARDIRSRGALRRQRQRIGKLMRSADADAIRAALHRLGGADRVSTRLFHDAERWRDRICLEGEPAINEFAELTAGSDAGHSTLRNLADDLAASTDEHRRRRLRRRIFREVHDRLLRAADAGAQ